MRKFTLGSLLAILLLSWGGFAWANEPAEPPTMFDYLNAPHAYWSKKFTTFANDIDRFFADERHFQETNKSTLRLDFNNIFRRGDYSPELSARIKLALPGAQKRLHLLLESDPERLARDQGEGATGTAPLNVLGTEVTTPGQYSAAVRFQRQKEGLWNFSTDAGIKLRMPLDPFLRVRGSYVLPLDNWRLRLTQSAYWFNSIGLGETTRLDLEYFLAERSLFRASSDATWLHDLGGFNLRQDFVILRELDHRNALAYQASVIGKSVPVMQTTAYLLQVRFRHRLHSNWLFYEINPQMHYPHDQGFMMQPLLVVRLEALLGGR